MPIKGDSINSAKLQVVMTPDLKKKLSTVAQKKGLSVSALIRLIMSEYVSDYNDDGNMIRGLKNENSDM